MNATESYLWVRLVGEPSIRPANGISEVYSRFGVGLRRIYLERHGSGLVNLLSLPSAFVAKGVLFGLTECFNRVRAILLLMNRLQKSCKDSSTDL